MGFCHRYLFKEFINQLETTSVLSLYFSLEVLCIQRIDFTFTIICHFKLVELFNPPETCASKFIINIYVSVGTYDTFRPSFHCGKSDIYWISW